MNNAVTYYGGLLTQPSFYSFAAAILVAILAGTLGCFIVWRKMSYFGDSLSHSALLGIALGIVSGISANISVIIACLFFAFLIVWLQRNKMFGNDTVLGILAHSAIAIGITVLGVIKYKYFVNEHALLFGQLLMVTKNDVMYIATGTAISLLVIYRLWGKLVLTSINEDLAQGEGVNPLQTQLAFTLLITLVVALSMKVVGILLVTALMVIPAAAARNISKSPFQMALFSSLLGVAAAISGILISAKLQVSTGPMIIVCSTALFLIFTLFLPSKK